MTNLTIQEKIALEEVFLCFQTQEKWYAKKWYIRNAYNKIVAKNKQFLSKRMRIFRRF